MCCVPTIVGVLGAVVAGVADSDAAVTPALGGDGHRFAGAGLAEPAPAAPAVVYGGQLAPARIAVLVAIALVSYYRITVALICFYHAVFYL